MKVRNTTMKNYEISFENCTVTLSASFLRKASTLGTKEYNEMLQLRRDLPGFQFQKAEVEKKSASKYKNLTYKHMREYIAASIADEAEAKAMLEQMKKVEALSKVQANPYKYAYVLKWFKKTFPNYGKQPERDANLKIVNTPANYNEEAA